MMRKLTEYFYFIVFTNANSILYSFPEVAEDDIKSNAV